MHIDHVKRYQAEKDHLMRHEGKHPANYSREEKQMHEAMMNSQQSNYHMGDEE